MKFYSAEWTNTDNTLKVTTGNFGSRDYGANYVDGYRVLVPKYGMQLFLTGTSYGATFASVAKFGKPPIFLPEYFDQQEQEWTELPEVEESFEGGLSLPEKSLIFRVAPGAEMLLRVMTGRMYDVYPSLERQDWILSMGLTAAPQKIQQDLVQVKQIS